MGAAQVAHPWLRGGRGGVHDRRMSSDERLSGVPLKRGVRRQGRDNMPAPPTALDDCILDAWRISAGATVFLVQHLTDRLWASALPGSPRRTVRRIVAHLHNARCSWMRSLAVGTGVAIPSRVDPALASRRDTVRALNSSSKAILKMLQAGLRNGGDLPGVSSAYIWGAWPRNVVLFTAYALSHEAHHRGQLLQMARELGQRLPAEVVAGLWQWSSRLREARRKRTPGG